MTVSYNTSESHIWIGVWENGWLLLPLAATLGGAWAFGLELEDNIQIGAALALVLGGWMPLWRAITRTNWAGPLSRWQRWDKVLPVPVLPYLQPGTPGAALHRSLSYARSWWEEEGRENLALPLKSAIIATCISLLLGLSLGRIALLLTLCLLSWAELATLWCEGKGQVGSIWSAVGMVGIPWTLGATLFSEDIALAMFSAIIVTLMVGFYASASWLTFLGPVLMCVYLIGQSYTFTAGIVLLLAIPGLSLVLRRTETVAYRQAIAPWVLLMVLVVAGVL